MAAPDPSGRRRCALAAPLLPGKGIEEEKGAVMTTPVAVDASGSDLPERFQRLAAEWKEKSRYLSNTAQMAMLKPYQQIVGIGAPAMPLILEEMRREPGQWFWALEAITGQGRVPPEAAGKVRLMTDAWLEWGRQRGLPAP